jgi:hypothetical protein
VRAAFGAGSHANRAIIAKTAPVYAEKGMADMTETFKKRDRKDSFTTGVK